MRYEGLVYRPPSEAGSLIIQATVGCPHNKCAFCTMYEGKKFKIRPVADIKEDLDMAKDYYGEGIKSVFFADGNTIIMKTHQLIDIFTYTRELFPYLERITLYGSNRFINLKSAADFKLLQQNGLSRLHCGLETGDNEVLKHINKGFTAEEAIEAGRKVIEAGIDLSEYIIVGVGGRERWQEHAINSAKVLNQINPHFIRLRTFLPIPGSLMYERYKRGEFTLLSPHEALRETKLFIQHLEGIDSLLLSDHTSNHWDVHGQLPGDKDKMFKAIDHALTIKESRFRDPASGRL